MATALIQKSLLEPSYMGNLQCFDFSFIKSRRVGSRVDSFDRRVTGE